MRRVLSRVAVKASATTIALLGSDVAFANPLYGRYTLDKQQNAVFYADSGPVATCGPKFAARVKETKTLDIAYDGTVQVNGKAWVLVTDTGNTVETTHPEARDNVRVLVWFWAVREIGKGALIVMRVSKSGEVRCADSVRFTGVFIPK